MCLYQQYEQVVTSLGISINMAQVTSPQYLNPVVGARISGSGVGGETGEDGFIDAIIEFEDESNVGYLEFRIKMRQLMNLIIGIELIIGFAQEITIMMRVIIQPMKGKTKTIINMEQFNYLTTAV